MQLTGLLQKHKSALFFPFYQTSGVRAMQKFRDMQVFSLAGNRLAALVRGVMMTTMLVLAVTASPAGAETGKVTGFRLIGRQVSDLEASIRFYQALDFQLQGHPSAWRVDEITNRLGGTRGVESRQAVMTVQSSVSDVPFVLVLREYRGIERQNWGGMSSSDLLSGHIDLTVLDDCRPAMEKLRAMNLLREPEMNISRRGEDPNGPRRFVFVQDPDGWYVELFALMQPAPGDPPAAPKVANSSATFENIDRVGKQAGFNHLGLNIIDPQKALAFYQGVLGGDYPPFTPPPAPEPGAAPRMNMMNGWFPQATTDNNLRFELIGFPQNAGKQPPAMKFTDIAVTYAGFEVTGLDDLYARTLAAGAIPVSDGIVEVADGRSVMIRDPDVGGFIELWERGK
jgi:catechol 2,3-dioxygenase-like lactoylglutathione lyase family enzyme